MFGDSARGFKYNATNSAGMRALGSASPPQGCAQVRSQLVWAFDPIALEGNNFAVVTRFALFTSRTAHKLPMVAFETNRPAPTAYAVLP